MVAALALLSLAQAGAPWVDSPNEAVHPGTQRRMPAAERAWIWTPTDVAAWSGEGLRDPHVVSITPSSAGLWTLTEQGGAALWNGEHWAHIDRRILGATTWRDLAIRDRTRWLAHGEGVTRILGTGELRTWGIEQGLPEGGARAVWPLEEGAWIATDDGVWLVDEEGASPILRDRACTALFADGMGTVLAACSDDTYMMPTEEPYPLLPRELRDPTAILPIRDGAWIAAQGGLYLRREGEVSVWWQPSGGRVLDIVRIDQGMLVAADADGAWIINPDPVALDPSGGVPGTKATAVASHPHPQKAWLGTHDGVALVNIGGAATPLPVAPLPAGAEVRALVPLGASAAVASERGLIWLGRQEPTGWSNLAAAAGNAAHDLVIDHTKAWWVLLGDAALRLDKTGRLERFNVADEGREFVRVGTSLGVVSAQGIRWWVPGAQMLAPRDEVVSIRSCGSAQGALWLSDEETVTAVMHGERQTWALRGVNALHGVRNAAWAATEAGLVSLKLADADPYPMWPGVITGAATALDVSHERLWVVEDEHRLWVVESGPPEQIGWDVAGRAPPIQRVVGDRYGAWLITEDGVHRVVLGDSTRAQTRE